MTAEPLVNITAPPSPITRAWRFWALTPEGWLQPPLAHTGSHTPAGWVRAQCHRHPNNFIPPQPGRPRSKHHHRGRHTPPKFGCDCGHRGMTLAKLRTSAQVLHVVAADWVFGEVHLAGRIRATIAGESDLIGTLRAEWAAVGPRLFLPPLSEDTRTAVIANYRLRAADVEVLPQPALPFLIDSTTEQLAELISARRST
jgi:hypothetical protein